MRLSSVLLLCVTVMPACFAANNYRGCFNILDDADFVNLDTPSATDLADCQAYCAGEGFAGDVGIVGNPSGSSPTRRACRCDVSSLTALPETSCPTVCTGAVAPAGTHCGGADFQTGSVYSIGPCIGICDDPHFTGLDGSRYDYMANPDRVVALISDRTVQVNGRFVAYRRNNTVVGEVGIRVCEHTVEIRANRSVVINGKLTDLNLHAVTVLSKSFSVKRQAFDMVRIYAGSWRMSIQMTRRYINVLDIVHLNKNDTFVHGVYGITGQPDHRQRKKELCQPRNEGGCELPGKWQDYELPVGTDLVSTDWTYKQFDAAHCASLESEAAQLQASFGN